MKKLLTVIALMAMASTANATDIGIGVDRETKYNSSGNGTTKTYNYMYLQHTWKQLGGITTKGTHSQNTTTSTTNFNEFKLSKDFKFGIDDGKSAFKIVPSFARRWDGKTDGVGSKSKDNLKIELKYSF